ncbi:MAG: hypothetical protein JNL62_24445, partial [Bryobacterales bacterium]|nr:hypothetical protein [Bryobacterales bacterium]
NFFPGAGLKPAATEVGFLTKLTPAGNGIVYSLYLHAAPGAVAADNSGSAYLYGHTSGNLPVKNAFQPQLAGLTDAFIAKFLPDGTLSFATYFGGSAEENGRIHGGIRVDTTGAIYVAGWTKSTNFPVKNAFQPANAGNQDAFIAKFEPSGTALVFSTYLGGSGPEFPQAFDIEALRHPVLAGKSGSFDYPVTQPENLAGGVAGGMLTRLDGSGQRLRYSTVSAGGVSEYESIAAEPSGSVALIGTGGAVCGSLGCVQRLSSDNRFSVVYAHSVLWPAYLSTVAADPFGNLIVTGGLIQEFAGRTGGIPIVNPVRYQSNGDDSLLMLLRPDGQVIFSTFWGGWVGSLASVRGTQYPIGAVGDSSGALYLAGVSTATDLFVTDNAPQVAGAGAQDAFLVKFAPGALQIITSVRVSSPVPYNVDGKVFTGSRSFQWLSGTTHRVEFLTKYQTSHARYTYTGDSPERIITVGSTDVAITGNYKTEIRVETQVLPAGTGSVIVTPPSEDGFYLQGTVVRFTAVPAPGYRLAFWSGTLFGTEEFQSRSIFFPVPAGPIRAIANFDTGVATTNTLPLNPITPCRILDTRAEYGFPAPFGPPALESGVIREVPVRQSTCGIPATATAYAANITVIPLLPLYDSLAVSAFPTGQVSGFKPTVYAPDGRVTTHGTIIRAGTNSTFSLYASSRTHVIIDITGYFGPTTAQPLLAGFANNCRALDTRQGSSLAPGQVRQVSLGRCAAPSAKAAWVTITAYPKGPLGWLSISPSSPPSTSILNSPQGEPRSTTAIVPVVGGSIPLQSSDSTDVTIDVMMHFDTMALQHRLTTVTPCRAYDTRTHDGGLM